MGKQRTRRLGQKRGAFMVKAKTVGNQGSLCRWESGSTYVAVGSGPAVLAGGVNTPP